VHPLPAAPRLLLPLAAAAACLASALAGTRAASHPASDPAAAPSYDRDVRPILSDRCFACHGPDPGKRQAKLRLDTFEGATAARKTGAAIVAGDPDASLVLERVHAEDPDERMPPVDSGKRAISDAERDTLRRWIEAGARYEPHWSFVAPVRPPEPLVRDRTWPRNAVDEFVLARLEAQGVAPSAPADSETLVRRLFLDVTGLPPTPEEIDAFLEDDRPDAYELLVDRLFEEEPYRSRHAERMTQPWLDAARYADTIGIHTDAGRQMWLWRDWVLEAYRENMPFDRFVTDQLAGDLLPGATDAQKIATGFLRNHVMTDEGGAIAEEYLVEYAVDRTATTGSVFLGLTLGCARCHDHKFDPVSQAEFYGMLSFFNSVEEPGLYSQLPDPQRSFEPFLVVPRPQERRERDALTSWLAEAQRALDATTPQDAEQRTAYYEAVTAETALRWETPVIVSATSSGGATLTPQDDGSILVSGANPDQDTLEITVRAGGEGLRLLLLEALPDPSLPAGRVGRAENGNAVLTGITVAAQRLDEPGRREDVPIGWAWADFEQANGDFKVVNVLGAGDATGWAVDAHNREGPRAALFLSDRPFGFAGGTELRVRLEHLSMYPRHTLGRVRLRVARATEALVERLPIAVGTWHVAGPFRGESPKDVYDRAFGPESDALLDVSKNFGAGNQTWRADENLLDGAPNSLPNGVVATYVGRRVFSPSARTLALSLGSDDAFRLFRAGQEVAGRSVERALAPDQDRVEVAFERGAQVLVLKDVNTGGLGGFYFRAEPRAGELTGDLVAGLLPPDARWPELDARIARAWQLERSPVARAARQRVTDVEGAIATLDARAPRTMVMKELPAPRPTFVLRRGEYDQADPERPVARGVPAAFGALAGDAPRDRLGLARWMLAPENPLVARVAVNRLFELVFGVGLVRTSEDLGMQGEWPSHPELLDWLAVELRESGWDQRHILRLLFTSSTYRQASARRADLVERDPENRWLASFPRVRLTAEAIRDQALYASGLLVEELGGRSVKPYQPDGLWPEVAMPASNTRVYERGQSADLWRRSIYTYWKRACPPPMLQAFDAPTRESCTILRPATNTPLQALALWNDPQLVEAARLLAMRTLDEEPAAASPADDDFTHARPSPPRFQRDCRTKACDEARLDRLARRCTGRRPDAQELASLRGALESLRQRFAAAPDDARALLAVGEARPMSASAADPVELAAWTLVASTILSLDATLVRD